MPATGFHLSVVPLRRSSGKSAVAKVAYITREKLRDERTGLPYDFTKRGGIEAVLHAQLKDAPEWSRDIGQAWNAIESVENRKNSQPAKMIDGLAFPHGIDAEARKHMLTDFMREQFGRKGLLWTAAIHLPEKDGDQRNYHAHVMWNERPLSADGFAKTKDREATNFDTRKDALAVMRERWAALSAKQLERAGLPLEAERWRQGHLTLEKQAELARARGDIEFAEECANREPTKHLGRAAVALERKGIPTERGDAWEATEARNEVRKELRQQAATLTRDEGRIAAEEAKAQAADRNRQAERAAVSQTMREAWQQTQGAALDFAIALGDRGLSLAETERGQFVAVDSRGEVHKLGRPVLGKDSETAQQRLAEQFGQSADVHLPSTSEVRAGLRKEQWLAERLATGQEQQRSARAAKLAGLEDVQTLRGLWRSADTAQTFLKAAQAEGFRLARVTERDADQSKADAAATARRDPARRAPNYGKGDLIAYNRQGYGLRLDGATLDDAKARDRMAQATTHPLPSLAEVRQVLLEEWKTREAAYRRDARTVQLGDRAHIQTLRYHWQRSDRAETFVKAIQEQGYTVARVTAKEATQSAWTRGALDMAQPAAKGREAAHKPPVYSKGDLIAHSAHGQAFRLDNVTLADAKAEQRLAKTTHMPLPSLTGARQAIAAAKAEREAIRDERRQQAPQSRAQTPQRGMIGMARAALGGMVEFLFGWLADRKPPKRGKAPAPRRNLATEAREASKRADKSLAGARDIEANYGHRLLQLDPEIQDSLRRAREAEQRRRDDDERERER